MVLRSFRPGFDPLFHFAEVLAKSAEQQGGRQSPGIIRDNLLNHWRGAKSNAKARAVDTNALEGMAVDKKHDILATIDLVMLKALCKQLNVEINSLKTALDRPLATSLISIDQREKLARSAGDNTNAFTDYIRAALLQDLESVSSQCIRNSFASIIAIYTTVVMKHINIRFGYQFDTILSILAGLISLLIAAVAVYEIFTTEQSMGENYTQNFAKEILEMKQLHHAVRYAIAILSYAMSFGMVVSFVCLVLQTASTLTVPVRFASKMIARIRLTLAKNSTHHIKVHALDKDSM